MTEMPLPTSDLAPRMTLAEMEAFLAAEFPQVRLGADYDLEAVGYGAARMRLIYAERHLRPGGTLSGPAMMALADVALYVALLGAIGPVKLAVTTSFSVNFLKRPDACDLIAHCRYLKIGRSLAVGEAELRPEGSAEAAAHVVATYSIPPRA